MTRPEGLRMTDLQTMRAIALMAHGGPEALVYRDDMPIPAPRSSEVLIKVGIAGVNNTDINTRVGWYSKGDGDAADASWGAQALLTGKLVIDMGL